MAEQGRRAFMTKLAAVAAASTTTSILPAVLQQALALPAGTVNGSIHDVEHVVILMQENRSFDHYFGTLKGVRGYGDPRPVPLQDGRTVFEQPVPGAADALLPFRLNTETTSASCMKSLDHSWKGSHAVWNGWDAWVGKKSPLTMGHLIREDIPFYHALADAFTICDAYHCSMFGPTDPNRLFLFSGTSGLAVGDHGPQVATNGDDENWTADMAHDKPGFAGLAWTTYADRLEAAGVSWRVYQEYDNFGDNSLAYFRQFRGLDRASARYRAARAIVEGSHAGNATTSGGDPLVAAFARDVAAGTLPQVSWIVAPAALCEHPDAPPGFGEVLISRMVEILVQHPETWARTVFIINYDENDGFFDHVPAPVPATSPAIGHSMVSTHGELYQGVPVGLGPRVPMLIVSPWTKGGWVNSELFDHTSVIRFLEARFGVAEPNITPWRRAVTGDLTSAFDFAAPNRTWAELPSTTSTAEQVRRACTLGKPVVPAGQAMPRQETGQRPARALPYVLKASATRTPHGLDLLFENEGAAGATLMLYSGRHESGPRHYTITRQEQYREHVPLDGPQYEATLFGANGFLRQFAGALEPLQVREQYDPAGGRLLLGLVNHGPSPLVVHVASTTYPAGAARTLTLAPGAAVHSAWQIARNDHWYDLSVRIDGSPTFLRRYAGHMETGLPSRSDPAFGAGQQA